MNMKIPALILLVILLLFTPLTHGATVSPRDKYINEDTSELRSSNDASMRFIGHYDILSSQGNFTMSALFSNDSVYISVTVISEIGNVGDYYSSAPVKDGRINLTIKSRSYDIPDIFHQGNSTYSIVSGKEVGIQLAGNESGCTVYSDEEGTAIRMFDSSGALVYFLDRTPIGFLEMSEISSIKKVSWLNDTINNEAWELRYTTMYKMEYLKWEKMTPNWLGHEFSNLFNGSVDSIITAAALSAHSYDALQRSSPYERCKFMVSVLSGAGITGNIEVIKYNNTITFVVNISGVVVDPVSMILPYGSNGLEAGNYSAYDNYNIEPVPEIIAAMKLGAVPYEANSGVAESTESEDYFAVLFSGIAFLSFAFTVFALLIVLSHYSRSGILPKKTASLTALTALGPGIYALLLADAAGAYIFLAMISLLGFISGGLTAITLAYIIFIRGIK